MTWRGTAALGFLVASLSGLSCGGTVHKASFAPPAERDELDRKAPFLKCHMNDGDVYVLEDWSFDASKRAVEGRGLRYDASRQRLGAVERYELPLDRVALFETSTPLAANSHGAEIGTLVVLTTVSAAVTVACLTNPKACFGSCPTFYADDGQGHLALEAEGFSASVARALEATDVDALWSARPASRTLDLLMTNEALETHAVDFVNVLAARRPPGGRVLRAGDRYWEARAFAAPARATAASGDVTSALRDDDGVEYESGASPTDLAERERVDLVFPATRGKLGLLVVARNSLLNTFLFYQLLAFMGTHAGDLFAELERHGRDERLARLGDALGGIDVSTPDATGAQRVAGSFFEVGPIAREAQLVPLPPQPAGDVRVRLDMTRGNWRIDRVALVELGDEVHPVRIQPTAVLRDGKPDAHALAELLDPTQHLVTFPGDRYTLRFELPEAGDELFLETRGYYYEWMRKEWLRDEDVPAAMKMLFDPRASLRELAPKYEKLEPDMDRIFRSSRVGRFPRAAP